MSSIPSNLARVPNSLMTSTALQNMTRTNVDLLRLTEQLSSAKRLNRPSDSPIESSLVTVLQHRARTSEQIFRNFDHADGALGTLDSTLGQMYDLLLEAKTLGADQVGSGATGDTRASTAIVIDSLLDELGGLTRSKFGDLHLLGGTKTSIEPFEAIGDGLRYRGTREGLRTELGSTLDIPITIGAEDALGVMSSRVSGSVDLNPMMTRETPLSDLRGDRGVGIKPGMIEFTIDNGTPVTAQVDVSDAKNVGDVLDAVEAAILALDGGALSIAFVGGLDIANSGDRFEVNASVGYNVTFNDIGSGTTVQDLGLDSFVYTSINIENTSVDLDPRLTEQVRIGDMTPAGGLTMGTINFENGGRSGSVTVTPTMTLSEFQKEVSALGMGLRVEIDQETDTINVVNEVSGWRMAISESGGATGTASDLGIRTMDLSTSLSEFNDGRGIEIANGEIDPITGLPDPDRNKDFRVTLTDGRSFEVDLTQADIQDVSTVLAAINAAAAAAVPPIVVPGEFEARLLDGSNGIVLQDSTGGGGTLTVTTLYGHAAEDLGLLDGTLTPGLPSLIQGSDRATVRVNSAFTALKDLAEALRSNDTLGISIASEDLEAHLDRLSVARAVVGGRAQRVGDASAREEDIQLMNQTVMSELEDLDYVEASSRYSLLQLAQQAGYAATSQSLSLTLLNFLR
ncbi:MAG: flagellin [Phycisphaerales bacterium JB043]